MGMILFSVMRAGIVRLGMVTLWDLLSNIQKAQGLVALGGLDSQEYPGEYLQAQLWGTVLLEAHAVHQTSRGRARAWPPVWRTTTRW